VIEVRARAIGPRGCAPVLRDVSLRIRPGERIAIVGANGAGKTTLLKALVGLLPVDGEVLAAGERVTNPKHAVAAGVGLVFQNPDDQLFAATVAEDVAFGPRNLGLDEAEVARRTREAIDRLGLGALADRAIETLSFGEKKRACLAGVLAMRPRVLLLDEPTAGLDPAGELELLRYFAELHRAGATLVCATHAMDLVPLLADRVLVLDAGSIAADGAPATLLRDAALLRRARLRTPLVAELGLALGWTPPPITVDEARETWNARRS
jgi:cobalt/nickel transport system ATP-binding protein